MAGKRAFQAEQQSKKIFEYADKIRGFVECLKDDPWHYDYSQAVQDLKNDNPADVGLIAQAERDVYQSMRRKGK